MVRKSVSEYIDSSFSDLVIFFSPFKHSYKQRVCEISTFYNSYFSETYYIFFSFIVFVSFVSIFLILLSYFFSEQRPDLEKMKGYECGFDPFSDARNTFSVKFFFIAVLFILFDIELLFFYAWILSLHYTNLFGFALFFLFYIILVILYVFEWVHDSLDW